MTEIDDTLPPADEFDVLSWLSTGTVVERTVEIVADQKALSRLDEINERLTELGVPDDPKADAPLSDDGADDEVAALEAEAAPLLERVEASRSVWTVRGLTQPEIEAAVNKVPSPRLPAPAPAQASEQQLAKAQERLARYGRESKIVDAERRLHMIAAAVVSVVSPQSRAASVSPAGVKALRDGSPYGPQQVDRLWAAIEAATEENVELPRPTSPGRSGGSRA